MLMYLYIYLPRQHNMDKRRFLQTCTSVALGTWGASKVSGAPARGLNIIVPFAPQGVSTLLAQEICQNMSQHGYGPCLVEHIPGMSNMVATRTLLKRAHDHDITLMIAGPSIFTIGQHLNPFMSFKPNLELQVLAPLMKGSMVLVTSRRSGIDSWDKLAVWPGPKKCAVSGLGSPSHVVAAYIDSSLFPLGSAHTTEGDLPGIQQVLQGDMTCAVVSIGSCKNHLDGSLHFLLSSSAHMNWTASKLPQPPTLSSVAQKFRAPDFAFDNWLAVVGPRNLPPQLAQTLQVQLQIAKSSPAMQQLIQDLLHVPLNLSPTEMHQRIEDNAHQWDEYVKRLQLHQALNLNL